MPLLEKGGTQDPRQTSGYGVKLFSFRSTTRSPIDRLASRLVRFLILASVAESMASGEVGGNMEAET